jgi:hypothetical protein
MHHKTMNNSFTTLALFGTLLFAPSCSEAQGTSVAIVTSPSADMQIGSRCSVIMTEEASTLGSLTPIPKRTLEGTLIYRGDHWVRVDTDSAAVWLARENIAALVLHSEYTKKSKAPVAPSSGMVEPSEEVPTSHVYGNRD